MQAMGRAGTARPASAPTTGGLPRRSWSEARGLLNFDKAPSFARDAPLRNMAPDQHDQQQREPGLALPCVRCSKPATLQCPKCLELKLERDLAAYCSQECFKVRGARRGGCGVRARPGGGVVGHRVGRGRDSWAKARMPRLGGAAVPASRRRQQRRPRGRGGAGRGGAGRAAPRSCCDRASTGLLCRRVACAGGLGGAQEAAQAVHRRLALLHAAGAGARPQHAGLQVDRGAAAGAHRAAPPGARLPAMLGARMPREGGTDVQIGRNKGHHSPKSHQKKLPNVKKLAAPPRRSRTTSPSPTTTTPASPPPRLRAGSSRRCPAAGALRLPPEARSAPARALPAPAPWGELRKRGGLRMLRT